MRAFKSALALIACSAFLFHADMSRAAPVFPSAIAEKSTPIEVQWRGWGWGPGWGRGWGYRGWGPGPAIVGGLMIGGMLTAAAIAEHRASERAMRACAREFREFDPRTGTYIGPRGEVRVCPYLY